MTTQQSLLAFITKQQDLFNTLFQAGDTGADADAKSDATPDATKEDTTPKADGDATTEANTTKNATKTVPKPPPPPRLFRFEDPPPRRPPAKQSGILNGFALDGECTPRYVLLSLMPNTIGDSKWPFTANTQGVKVVMTSEYIDASRPLDDPEPVLPMIGASNTRLIRPGVDPTAVEGAGASSLIASSALAMGLVAASLF